MTESISPAHAPTPPPPLPPAAAVPLSPSARSNPAHNPPPKIRPRWTRRRLYHTIGNTIIGFFIGLLLTPILMLLSFLFGRFGSPIIAMATMALGPLAYFLLRSAAYHTCAKHPAGPRGICVGLAAGALIPLGYMADLALGGGGDLLSSAVGLLAAAGQSIGGYHGGMKGLINNLGPTAQGVGATCATCGYDMRGIPEMWACPECGDDMRYLRAPGEFEG